MASVIKLLTVTPYFKDNFELHMHQFSIILPITILEMLNIVKQKAL